jgi:hypothetical protein
MSGIPENARCYSCLFYEEVYDSWDSPLVSECNSMNRESYHLPYEEVCEYYERNTERN